MENQEIVKTCDEVVHSMMKITKIVVEEGYANDTRILQAIVAKAQELKKRWEGK